MLFIVILFNIASLSPRIFKLNEEGTEAAAATAIRMVRCASAAIRPPKPKFIADHPFAFLLSNQINHQPLFNVDSVLGMFLLQYSLNLWLNPSIRLDEVGTIACAVTLIKPTVCACCGSGPPDPKFIADHPFAFFLASFHQGHYQNEQQIDFYSLPTLLFGGIFSETNKINRNYFSAFAPSKFDEKSVERVDPNGFGKLLSSKSNERKFPKPNDMATRGGGGTSKSNENIPTILSLITPIEKVKSEEDKSKKTSKESDNKAIFSWKTSRESGNKLVDLYAVVPPQPEPIYAEYVEQQPAAAIGIMDVIYG